MTSIVHDVSYPIAGSFETGKTGSKQKINQQFTELLILYYNVKDDLPLTRYPKSRQRSTAARGDSRTALRRATRSGASVDRAPSAASPFAAVPGATGALPALLLNSRDLCYANNAYGIEILKIVPQFEESCQQNRDVRIDK